MNNNKLAEIPCIPREPDFGIDWPTETVCKGGGGFCLLSIPEAEAIAIFRQWWHMRRREEAILERRNAIREWRRGEVRP